MSKHSLCREDELQSGHMRPFTVSGQKIVLYRLSDGYFATQASCTHIFAPLARGKILDDCKVQCPLHRARFDIRTGAVVDWANFPPGIQLLNAVRREKGLRRYEVQIKDGEVLVDMPA